MKGFVIGMLVVFMLVASFVVAEESWDKQHPLLDMTVLVGNKDAPGMGTGFIVTSDGYIATAAHVVNLYGTTLVVFPEPPFFETARIVYVDKLNDWAIIKVDRKDLSPIVLGSIDDVELTDPLIYCGHPNGIGWLMSRGILSGVKFDENGRRYIFSDLSVYPGASGSGIFTADYKLIGIIQMGLPGLGIIGIATDDVVGIATAAIMSDRRLEAQRKWLEALAEKSKIEWKELEKKLEEE